MVHVRPDHRSIPDVQQALTVLPWTQSPARQLEERVADLHHQHVRVPVLVHLRHRTHVKHL